MLRVGQGYVAPKYRERRAKALPAEPLPTTCAEQLALAQKIGARMRELRLREGFTQAEVSDRSGIARSNVTRLETGRLHVPSIDSVVRYCKAIGVQPTEVLSVLDEREGA